MLSEERTSETNTTSLNLPTVVRRERREKRIAYANANLSRINSFKLLPFSIGAILAASIAIGSGVFYQMKNSDLEKRLDYTSDLKNYAEKIVTSSHLTQVGDLKALSDMQSSERSISNIIYVMQNGGRISAVDSVISPVQLPPQVNELLASWEETKPLLANVLTKTEGLIKLYNDLNAQKNTIADLLSNVQQLKLTALRDRQDQSVINQIDELIFIATRLQSEINNVFDGKDDNAITIYSFVRDIRSFNTGLLNLIKGNNIYGIKSVTAKPTTDQIQNIGKNIAPVSRVAEELAVNSNNIMDAYEAASKYYDLSIEVSKLADEIEQKTNSEKGHNWLFLNISIVSILILIALLGVIMLIFYERSKRASIAAKELKKNQNNQAAIDALLAQLVPISMGDLSKKIEIKDAFVSQIAEKFDSTRALFGSIIKKIKETSNVVTTTTDSVDNTSKDLVSSYLSQSSALKGMLEQLSEVTGQIDETSRETWKAAKESSESLAKATAAERLIKTAVEQMNETRTSIKESSKKIKKAGEAAQSVIAIVGQIQKIIKYIDVLSLNVAIKAVSSGESGKELSVVAEEVKRLSGESKAAMESILTSIEDLLLQHKEAIDSMEETTKRVVNGTETTKEVGKTLSDISASTNISTELIQAASAMLEKKSEEMSAISISLSDLSEKSGIAKQTMDEITLQTQQLKEEVSELQSAIRYYRI